MAQKTLKTPEAIASYVFLNTPQKSMNEGEKDKYSMVLVFTTEAQKSPLFKAMKKAAVDAAIEKWGDKAAGMIRSDKIRMPFRDDWEEKGYPEGSVFITVKNEKKPGVVSIYPDPNNGNKPMPITDEDEIYSGMICCATVRAFAYDQKGNKGVSFALNNVQKLRDGERIDGRKKAEDDFEADLDAVGNLEDLENGEDTPPAKSKGRKDVDEDDGDEDEQQKKPARKLKASERWSPEDRAAKPERGKKGSKKAATVPADEDLSDLYE